jgi:SAM-dependent methyltransferase
MLPRLVRAGLTGAAGTARAWERYWRGVARTGDDGDVLWDGAGPEELRWTAANAAAHFDPDLPVVDLGCGNGRQSRLLAERFPRVVGVDRSAAAVERARRESAGLPGVSFVVGDVTDPELGVRLGPANVFVRGVLHVLGRRDRLRLVATAAAALGDAGRLLVVETAFPGGGLAYLAHLGGEGATLPHALGRAVDSGIPAPRRMGARELAACLPQPPWRWLSSGPVSIQAVGSGAITGYHVAARLTS